MKVEALYDHGRLEFIPPLQLKHERLKLVVEVPDEEVVISLSVLNPLPPEVLARAQAMRDNLDAIRNAPPPPDDELPELTEKQREWIAAFAWREDR